MNEYFIIMQLYEDFDHLYEGFDFTILKTKTFARLGRLSTPHGTISTPAFVFCATKGSIKSLSIDQVISQKSQIILCNTYHMLLQPGPDIVFQHHSLHNFLGWPGPMMTDSGGFQIFSLGHGGVSSEIKGANSRNVNSLVKITDEGAKFRSYINGDVYMLTPEKSMEVQVKLGADLCFAFDECTPFNVQKSYTEKSMHRSHEWELRSLKEFAKLQKERAKKRDDLCVSNQNTEMYEQRLDSNQNNNSIYHDQSIFHDDDISYREADESFFKRRNVCSRYLAPQSLYGIVQGGIYSDLREKSVEFISNNHFFGNAIGGSLGGSTTQMYEIVNITMKMLRDKSFNRPVHLLGIGRMKDIIFGVSCGIDTFDCVHPTRIARHGCALILPEYHKVKSVLMKLIQSDGNNYSVDLHDNDVEHINLNNSIYKMDMVSLQENCLCDACRYYTRSYVHHLIKAKELLGYSVITLHNVWVMNKFMEMIRDVLQEI